MAYVKTEATSEGERTADSIIEWFKGVIASKQNVPPELWLESALLLNVLRLDEAAKLNEMRRKIAQSKVDKLDKMEKRNVSEAELRVEATEDYEQMKNQQAKCDIIEEFVLLAKKYANQDKF